jgi:hypothetical protein
MKNKDVPKLSAMTAVPAVVEAMVETSDDTKVVADTTTDQVEEVEDMVEMTPPTTAHPEDLVVATQAMEATRVPMEVSNRPVHLMAADMAVQTSFQALLSMHNLVVATQETLAFSAWLLAC